MSSPLLKSGNYKRDYLDKGAFGVIFKITANNDKKQVFALKQIDLSNLSDDERKLALEEAQNEYKLLLRGIPNVVRSFGSNHDQREQVFAFSTELMEFNLKQFILKNGPLSLDNFIPIFSDILSGKFPFVLNFKIHSDIFH